jgi:hypothetical protein
MSQATKNMHPITTRNGVEVYVDLIHSPAAAHIGEQPYILSLAKELLAATKLTGAKVSIEHDFGRVIGTTEIVETTEKDAIVYAKRMKQPNYSRFVKRRQFAPSNYLSMLITKDDSGNYELQDVWIGRHAPPFPTEEEKAPESETYWANHAIVLDGQALQLRTLTKDAPF